MYRPVYIKICSMGLYSHSVLMGIGSLRYIFANILFDPHYYHEAVTAITQDMNDPCVYSRHALGEKPPRYVKSPRKQLQVLSFLS